jgi:hypothetical protein
MSGRRVTVLVIAVGLLLVVVVFFAVGAEAAAIASPLVSVFGIAVVRFARPTRTRFGDGPLEIHALFELDLDQRKRSKQSDDPGAIPAVESDGSSQVR